MKKILFIRKSFRLRIFLIFMLCVSTIFLINLGVVKLVAPAGLHDIFEANLLEQHWRWSTAEDQQASAETLKSELRDAIHNAKSSEILVFTAQRDGHDASVTEPDFSAFIEGVDILERQATLGSMPHIKQAVGKIGSETWQLTQLTTPSRIIVTAVNRKVVDRSFDEMFLVRSKTIRITFPFLVALLALSAVFVTKKMLEPTRRIQRALDNVGGRDLHFRLSVETEDDEYVEFINVFNGMLERLERSFLQASRFSSDAAHELRTPLTIMQGYVERAIYEAVPGSPIQIQLSLIADEIERLASITQKLLLLSQADAGRLSLDLEPLNVSDLLDELVSDAQSFEPPLTITGKIEKKRWLMADKNLFQQMINNLFNNALKYNLPGGWVAISAWAEGGQLRVLFSNPAAPMSAQAKSQVFERFFRGDAAHNRKIDGTGLGLSLSREIAIAHGGSLRFEVDDQNVVTVEFSAPLGTPKKSSSSL